MSRELTQKVIEAGIIPAQAVKQLKAWRQLPEDTREEECQQVTQAELMGFVRDIEALLEEDGELPELRETMFDLGARFANSSQDCTAAVRTPNQSMTINTQVLVDKLSGSSQFLIFIADKFAPVITGVGNQIALRDGKVYEICEVTPLYNGEDVAFYRCHVQEVPEHAQMSELRQHGA